MSNLQPLVESSSPQAIRASSCVKETEQVNLPYFDNIPLVDLIKSHTSAVGGNDSPILGMVGIDKVVDACIVPPWCVIVDYVGSTCKHFHQSIETCINTLELLKKSIYTNKSLSETVIVDDYMYITPIDILACLLTSSKIYENVQNAVHIADIVQYCNYPLKSSQKQGSAKQNSDQYPCKRFADTQITTSLSKLQPKLQPKLSLSNSTYNSKYNSNNSMKENLATMNNSSDPSDPSHYREGQALHRKYALPKVLPLFPTITSTHAEMSTSRLNDKFLQYLAQIKHIQNLERDKRTQQTYFCNVNSFRHLDYILQSPISHNAPNIPQILHKNNMDEVSSSPCSLLQKLSNDTNALPNADFLANNKVCVLLSKYNYGQLTHLSHTPVTEDMLVNAQLSLLNCINYNPMLLQGHFFGFMTPLLQLGRQYLQKITYPSHLLLSTIQTAVYVFVQYSPISIFMSKRCSPLLMASVFTLYILRKIYSSYVKTRLRRAEVGQSSLEEMQTYIDDQLDTLKTVLLTVIPDPKLQWAELVHLLDKYLLPSTRLEALEHQLRTNLSTVTNQANKNSTHHTMMSSYHHHETQPLLHTTPYEPIPISFQESCEKSSPFQRNNAFPRNDYYSQIVDNLSTSPDYHPYTQQIDPNASMSVYSSKRPVNRRYN